MGSAAPAPLREALPQASAESADEPDTTNMRPFAPESVAEAPVAQAPSAVASSVPDIDRLQSAVLQALTDGNQRILVSMLSAGEWSLSGNELVIKVGESQTVVDMSLGPDAKRLAIASASGVLGRAVKLRVVPGVAVAPQEKKNGAPRPSGPGGRGRAEQDPVVQRMRDKFGAEIRTVIDYREKR
jgi:hypothetical protein